jgi:oligosaccharide repeat unit polymerase
MHHYFNQRIKLIKSPYFSQTFFYILGIVISSMLMIRATGAVWGRPSENLAIYSFLVLIILLAKSVNFEISHPFIWFNILFTAYSLSTPIMNIMGEYHFYPQYSKNFDYIQVIFAQYLAILVFSLAVGPKKIYYNPSIYKAQKNNSNLFRGSYYVLIFGTIISLVYLYGIMHSGAEEKMLKIAEYNPIIAMSFCWTFITVSMVTILARKKLLGKSLPFILILLYSSYFPLCLLVGGDRYPLFYYLLSLTLTVHIFYKKIKFRYFLLVLILGMYLSTILGALKMFLLSDIPLANISNLLLFDYRGIILTSISGEFRSASENLAILMQAVPQQIPFSYGNHILPGLISMFMPNFLLPRATFITTQYWFSETFFQQFFESGGGLGFSLVGVGYLNFGYPGIVGLFLFLGWSMRKLYKRSANSLVFLIYYLCFLPIFCLSIRGDLATIFNQGIKQILLSILMMIVIGKFIPTNGASVRGPERGFTRGPSFWRSTPGQQSRRIVNNI